MSFAHHTAQPEGYQPSNDPPATHTPASSSRPATHVDAGTRSMQTDGSEVPAGVPSSRRAQRHSGATGEGTRPHSRSTASNADTDGMGDGVGGADGGSDGSKPDDDSASAGSDLQQEPDPFYDDAADEEDAAWADQRRGGRVSDAVLSCPGCFTTLCIDCQRHEKYHHQYRAMFVMNCKVDEEEADGQGGGGGGGGREFDPAAGGHAGGGGGGGGGGGRRHKRARGSAHYRRVRCGVCGTEVGALEVGEELYHFYHIFPSNA